MTVRAKAATLTRSLRDPDLARELARTVRERWSSEHEALGLRRDLAVEVPVPPSAAGLLAREWRPGDAPHLLGPDASLPAAEKADREVRRRMLAAGIGTPLVVAGPDDVPVYLQWVFTAADDDDVRAHFGAAFPRIGPGSALLENLYVPSAHRGRGLAGAGLVRVAEHVRDRYGARECTTFVGVDNTPSLKAVARAGFVPHVRRVQRWHRMRQSVEFTPVASAAVAGGQPGSG